ncbi:hypothetical protein CQA57_05340, partial [Helicobacter anseris]
MFLSANIASAGSSWSGSGEVNNSQSTDNCTNAVCAYTSHGNFTKGSGANTLNFQGTTRITDSAYTLTAKGVTINVTAPTNTTANMIDVKNRITLNLADSYLKFQDQATGIAEHFLRAIDNGASLTATFNGGIGKENIGGQDYNNIAFYGTMSIQSTNNNSNSIKFNNGASMIGYFNLGTSAAKIDATVDFIGGGSLVAIGNDHYINKTENVKGKAINISQASATGGKLPTVFTINFGESRKVETVATTDKDTLLDKDGVVVGAIGNSNGKKVTTQENTTVSDNQTLITNAIRGDISVGGYGTSTSTLNLNFYNKGLIEGKIEARDSSAQVNANFTNDGTIKSDSISGNLKAIFTTTGNVQSDAISTDVGAIYLQGSDGQTLQVDQKTKGLALSVTGSGGKSDRKIFITDYDATSGFKEDQDANTGGTLTLNAKSLTMSNNDGSSKGQQFVVDYKDGSVVINSGEKDKKSITISQLGHTNIIRFRDENSTSSSITIGSDGNNNGDVFTSGAKGKTLFQAKTITINGGIYGSGGFDLSGNATFTAYDTLSTDFVGIIKTDGSGGNGSKYNNTITAQTIKINPAGTKGLSANNGSSAAITRGGNIAIFNNISGGNNTIISENTSGTNNSLILGDVVNYNGSNNIKISGQSAATLPSLVGNITTNSGSNNIVFVNTLLAPSNIADIFAKQAGGQSPQTTDTATTAAIATYLGTGATVGNITTKSGTTNLVLRQAASSTTNGIIPIYTVKTTGGTANLVMQGPVNVEADIDYGTSGITNLIFASNNDGKTADEFKNGVAG